jgi:hypothetical protein
MKDRNEIFDNEDEEATEEEMKDMAWTVISSLVVFVLLIFLLVMLFI